MDSLDITQCPASCVPLCWRDQMLAITFRNLVQNLPLELLEHIEQHYHCIVAEAQDCMTYGHVSCEFAFLDVIQEFLLSYTTAIADAVDAYKCMDLHTRCVQDVLQLIAEDPTDCDGDIVPDGSFYIDLTDDDKLCADIPPVPVNIDSEGALECHYRILTTFICLYSLLQNVDLISVD